MLGFPEALGKSFQDRLESLRRFGKSPSAAVKCYLSFLASGIDNTDKAHAGKMQHIEEMELAGSIKGWPAVIGDHEFAHKAMAQHEVARHRTHRQADYASVLDRLAKRVCSEYDITKSDLFRKGRSDNRTLARTSFCRQAHFEELLPYAAIARYLGTEIAPVVNLSKR